MVSIFFNTNGNISSNFRATGFNGLRKFTSTTYVVMSHHLVFNDAIHTNFLCASKKKIKLSFVFISVSSWCFIYMKKLLLSILFRLHEVHYSLKIKEKFLRSSSVIDFSDLAHRCLLNSELLQWTVTFYLINVRFDTVEQLQNKEKKEKQIWRRSSLMTFIKKKSFIYLNDLAYS